MDEKIHKAFDRHARQKKEQISIHQRCAGDFKEGHRIPKAGYTFRELRDYLNGLGDDALAQQAQLLGPGGSISDSIMLEPIIGAGTVREMCSTEAGEEIQTTHSALDFQHHPEQVVLLSDYSPFGEDGDTGYEMKEDEDGEIIMVGDVTGKVHEVIERKRCEPTVKASRTPGFRLTFAAPDDVLTQMQEELAQKSKAGLTEEEAEKLNNIQAELYRRIYRLDTKEEMMRKMKEERELNDRLDSPSYD